MKRILTAIILVLLFNFTYSQNIMVTQGFHSGDTVGLNVVATAGAYDTSSSNSVIVNWTLGEPIVGSTVSPVGIELLKQIAEMKVYPNPTSDKVNVEILTSNDKPVDLVITLFDMGGKMIYSEKVKQAKYKGEIDLTELPSGHYMLNISTAEGYVAGTYKVLKVQ